MAYRILASYDRPAFTADDISHARRIMDAHGGKSSRAIAAALRTLSSYDNNVPRGVVLLLRQHLAHAYRREANAHALQWRPLR